MKLYTQIDKQIKISNSQFIRAVDGLCYSVAILQIGGHLEGVDVNVRSLSQGHQLPQSYPERPL